ncbi:pentatricopeptide repeat-containing protein At3g62890 [Nicotiana tabacum]|uniref:Pentatricopeptide repeat-containing protein At3g62890 n=1 Tax=Nicotiana tabacum TaxID=4097 RepID=A0A1S4C4Q8_TOBAC|nr:PREDICTED: pentatricopeptide repeat-containing protein At3g62890 [Nicotiana tabacum]
MQVSTRKLISLTHPSLNLSHPTVESFVWNTLIRAHVQRTHPPTTQSHTPLSIFLRMRFHGVQLDYYTFPFLLHSVHSPSHLQLGRLIHSQSILFGFSFDPFVQTSLISMYTACGNVGSARRVFDEMPQPDLPSWNSIMNANVKAGLLSVARELFDKMPSRNVISWSSMLDGYVRWGQCEEALVLFSQMQEENKVTPNEYTMSILVAACEQLGSLEHGKWAHAYVYKLGMDINVVLGTSLIEMYAKCGSIVRARLVFENLGPKKDLMAWSAMISGLAMHGRWEDCLRLFSNMVDNGVRPDDITFLGVLSACVHGGLVRQGKEMFERISKEFGISPSVQHYGCMIDLYGRAGLINEAWNLVNTMPMEPDVLIWGALLSGARICGDIETCEVALNKIIKLDPTNSAAYVLLSNVYAKMGRWKDARHIRNLMETKRVKKVPGLSSIEVDGRIR